MALCYLNECFAAEVAYMIFFTGMGLHMFVKGSKLSKSFIAALVLTKAQYFVNRMELTL